MYIQKYCCFIFLLSCLIFFPSIIKSDSDFSILNTEVLPLETNYTLPINNGEFKIDVTIKNEDDEVMIINEDDQLFNDLKCFLNGTIELYKYIDQFNNFVCVYKCNPPDGYTFIDLKHNDILIKKYNIGEKTGILDLSKTIYYSPSDTIYDAGKDVSIDSQYFDTYGYGLSIESNYHIYQKTKCVTNNPNGITKSIYNNKIICKTSTKKSGSYISKIEYEHSPSNKETLLSYSYNVLPLENWDPSLSSVQFPTIVFSYGEVSIKITSPKDRFGNNNSSKIKKAFRIYLTDTSGNNYWISNEIQGTSSLTFKTVLPYIPYNTVKLKLCQVGLYNCKISSNIGVWSW